MLPTLRWLEAAGARSVAGKPLGRDVVEPEGRAETGTGIGADLPRIGEDRTRDGVDTATAGAFSSQFDDSGDDLGGLMAQRNHTATDLLLIHTMPTFGRVVQVGDLTDDEVAHAEFPSQFGLGLTGHANDMGAACTIDGRLGRSAELRALDDHQCTGLPVGQTHLVSSHAGQVTQTRTEPLSDVGSDPVFEDGRLTSTSLVDSVIHEHEHVRFVPRPETAHSGHGDYIRNAELLEGNQVTDVVDLVGRRLVSRSVPRQKHHFRVADLAMGHKNLAEVDGVMPPVRRFLETFQELEGRSPNDAIFGLQLVLLNERAWRCLSTDLLC